MWESGSSYAPPRWRLANHLGRDHAPSQESTALLMPHWEGVRLTKDRVNIVTMTFDLTLRLCAIGFFYLATLVIIPQLMESRSKPPGFVLGRGVTSCGASRNQEKTSDRRRWRICFLIGKVAH